MSILQVGFVAVLPALCGFIGGVLGGWISDTLLRRGVPLSAARKVPIVAGLLLSTIIVGCNYVSAQWAVIALMSLAFFGKGVGALGWAVMADVAPKEATGLAGGLFNTFGNLAGIVTPIVIGYILQADRLVRRRAGLRRRARAARGGELPRDRRRHPAHRAAADGCVPRRRRAGDTMSPRAPRLLLAAAFVLFATWSLVVPINEAPDEPAHWQYARYLHDHWRLPHYAPGFEEANSPPLAYALFAPFATDAGSPGHRGRAAAERRARRAWRRRGCSSTPARPTARFWPQRLARLLAAAISVGTVVFVWRAGLAAGGPRGRAARGAGRRAAADVRLPRRPRQQRRAARPAARRRRRGAWSGCCASRSRGASPGGRRRRSAWPTCRRSARSRWCRRSRSRSSPPSPPATWRVRAWRLGALALAGAIVAPWSIRNVVLYGDPFASEAMRHAVAHIITDRSLFSSLLRQRLSAGADEVVHRRLRLGQPADAAARLPPLRCCSSRSAPAARCSACWRRRLDWRLAAVLVVAVPRRAGGGRPHQPAVHAAAGPLPAARPAGLRRPDRARPASAAARARAPRVAGRASASRCWPATSTRSARVVLPAYHPAPIRTLASGERVMVPSLLSDMAVLDGDSHWIVTGADAEWMTHVEAAADRSPRSRSSSRPRDAGGAARLRLLRVDRSRHAREPAGLRRLAGRRPAARRARPLRGQPGWTGEVSHLRLDPFQAVRPASAASRCGRGTRGSCRGCRRARGVDGATR